MLKLQEDIRREYREKLRIKQAEDPEPAAVEEPPLE